MQLLFGQGGQYDSVCKSTPADLGGFAVIVLGLLLYRFLLTWREDTSIHFDVAGQSLSNRQSTVAHLVELVDYWGKLLTVVTLLYGVGIAAAYLYVAWQTYPK